MSNIPATSLIKCDIQTDIVEQWRDFVDGGNGCLYGIPWDDRRVVEFSLEDKNLREIGPDLRWKFIRYWKGIRADNGSIYCMPFIDSRLKHLLKIIPKEGKDTEVQILKDKQLPVGNWLDGTLANDGCIYYFPHVGYGGSGGRILKLDPNNDSLSLVGEEVDKWFTTVVLGNDGCIYGRSGKVVIKFNPKDYSLSQVGSNLDVNFSNGAVLGNDGNMYSANQNGQILKIDAVNNDWTIIGSNLCNSLGWGHPVLGADKCIYFPPADHDRVLKYNPATQNRSMIGDSYDDREDKWLGAVLASDGFIYCIPYNANDILRIDSRHINEQIIEIIDEINSINAFQLPS